MYKELFETHIFAIKSQLFPKLLSIFTIKDEKRIKDVIKQLMNCFT